MKNRIRLLSSLHPGKRIALIRDLCRGRRNAANPGSSLRCGRDDNRFLLTLFFLTIASAIAPAARAQQMGNADALRQLVPALLGPQATPSTHTLHVSNGDGSGNDADAGAVDGPMPPTAPSVPSVHMGGASNAAGGVTPDLNTLIPGLAAPPAPDEDALALTTARRDSAAKDADYGALHTADTAIVAQVIEPVRVRLQDGRIIQLTGIDTADDDPYDPGPVSIAARNALKIMLEGKPVRLHVTRDAGYGRISRLGDVLAQLEVPRDGTWVQGALLSAGLARVRPTERDPEMADQMMALEAAARTAHRGLWADPRYAVLTPENAAKDVNRWVIVEGRVFGAAEDRNVTYLNFGPDYRKDFTVGIASPVRRQLDAAHIDAQSLAGQNVRVRGWLRTYNGPYLDLINAAWLEVIPETNTHMP